MNKQKFIHLLDFLEGIYIQDKKKQEASDVYFNEVYPGIYPPIREGILSSCLSVVFITQQDIYSDLEYYFLEAKNMDSALVSFKDGREYDFTKKEELITYMEDCNLIK